MTTPNLQVKLANQKFVTAIYAIELLAVPVLFRSIDGGRLWTALSSMPYSATGYRAISMQNPESGVAAQQAGLYRTVDGGITWTQVVAGINMFDVVMLPDGRGWAVGETATMKKTIDGGATWSTVPIAGIGTTQLNSVAVVPTDGQAIAGYVCGEAYSGAGVILTSPDGDTWTLRASGTATALHRIATGHTAASSIYAVALYSASSAGARYSVNSGSAWTASAGTIPGLANDAAVLRGGARIIAGAGGTSRSVDSGANFSAASPPGPEYAMTSIDDNTAWIMKTNCEVVQTTDGGATWSRVGYTSQMISCVSAVTGYVSSGNGLTLDIA